MVAEAEENNLDWDLKNPRFDRWHTCGLCEQKYHGVVKCALGWAIWKTYLGRPETDQVWILAMTQLGNGLTAGDQHEDALSVREAQLSILRRHGGFEGPAHHMLVALTNLAITYEKLGRHEEALRLKRDVYSGTSKLCGAEHRKTLQAANNYGTSFARLGRYAEAKALFGKITPVARRVLGEADEITLTMRSNYARALHDDPAATLDDLSEAVSTLAETERTARRVFGGAHPDVVGIVISLRTARARLAARETPSPRT